MSGFYRIGEPGKDSYAHINTGRKPSGQRCVSPGILKAKRRDLQSRRFLNFSAMIPAATCGASDAARGLSARSVSHGR